MIHIYLYTEEDRHRLDDLGSTCGCIPRIRILDDGSMLCIHSVLEEGHKEMDDAFIDDVLRNVGDTDDNIRVEDV